MQWFVQHLIYKIINISSVFSPSSYNQSFFIFIHIKQVIIVSARLHLMLLTDQRFYKILCYYFFILFILDMELIIQGTFCCSQCDVLLLWWFEVLSVTPHYSAIFIMNDSNVILSVTSISFHITFLLCRGFAVLQFVQLLFFLLPSSILSN